MQVKWINRVKLRNLRIIMRGKRKRQILGEYIDIYVMKNIKHIVFKMKY